MKKLLLILIAPFVISSCQKDPDYDEMSNNYLVFTTHDPAYNFSNPTTVYVPAVITLLDNPDGSTAVWDDEDSERILNEFRAKLGSGGCGYEVVDVEAGADLRLNVSFVEDITYFVDYPYWWWDPYWWDYYWPSWGWYYPYPVVYGYAIGSLIGELINPVNLTEGGDTPPSVWYTYIAGAESGSEDVDTNYMVTGIDQAFAQSSSYLKK